MATDADSNNDVLPLSTDDVTFWRAEIERADKLRDDTLSAWDSDGNLNRYTPKTVRRAGRGAMDGDVNVAKDFSDVERKNAALFHSTPEIALVPDPGTNPVALALHQELLNTLLGDDYMAVLATISPTIQDCLVAIQPVPTEIGYTAVTVQVEHLMPTPGAPPDPMTGQPPMSLQLMPVVVWEQIFWRRLSPKAQLMPIELRSTRYDDSPWLGYKWRKPVTQVRREYQLPDEWSGGDTLTSKPYFSPLTDQTDNSEPMIGGIKLWYRAYLRDPTVTHPEVMRELEFVEGQEQPIVHRPCPYQTIGPDGRLTPDSIIGFPDHPLALRDLTDSAYVAADCTLTSGLTRELNRSRTLNIQQRDASKLHVLYDPSRLNPEVREKLTEGNAPKLIPVEPGALDAGMERVMAQVPALQQSRESFTTQQIIEHDRAGVLGIDANRVGAASQGSQTATEVSAIQRNSEARFDREMRRAVRWYLKGVQKVSALVLRYGDRLAVEILGPQRGPQWVQAKQAGEFAKFKFQAVSDSGHYMDVESRKRTDMQLYNMTAKDPTLNRGVVQARLATDFGLDPSQWIVSQKPDQQPQPPTLSLAVKPEDLDPALPSYIGTYAILTATGVKGLPPPLSMMQSSPPPPPPPVPQQPHGGMAELMPRLNQHQLDETGQRSGPPVPQA